MYLNNIRTHFTSILSLFLLCTTLILPILIFMKPISSWLAGFDNIDGIVEATPATGGTFYTIASILNLPLFFNVLIRQSNTRMINQIYTGLFFLLSIVLVVFNPMGVLTTAYSLQTILFVTAIVFVILKYVRTGILKQVILIAMVITLGVCGETMGVNYSGLHLLYYLLFYLMGYVWNFFDFNLSGLSSQPIQSVYDTASYLYTQLPGISLIFVMEIFLIILILYGRTWIKNYYGGDLVVHNPIDLNKRSSYNVSNAYQYTYTLSFWVNLEATSPGFSSSSNEYTDVVMYGGNVLIAYNSSLNTIRTVMKNESKKTVYDMNDIPLQKWNHVVLSYANGTLDLFLNGELQKSTVAVPQLTTQEMIVGAEQGVYGKLCTMMFYNKVLTMEEIQALYTQFKDKNPPTL